MGAWIERHFAWRGQTSRDEYRRWLPLILLVDLAIVWAVANWGERGKINLSDFGWTGLAMFGAMLPYALGWIFLTARRLRSADISRSWLVLTIVGINIPVGGVYLNISFIVTLLLTAVGALAPDRTVASAS